MKFIISNTDLESNELTDFSIPFILKKRGHLNFLINDEESFVENEHIISCTDGYLKDFTESAANPLKQSLAAAENVIKQWPVKPSISGAFANFTLSRETAEFILCTDAIGIYPLYYLIQNKKIYISNSTILIGRFSRANIDHAGVFQRAVGPQFSNMGSRTILKNCKRLLPGEYLRFDKDGSLLEKKYDNGLYQKIGSPHLKDADVNGYWQDYKREVLNCTENSSVINVALSGGIDSRIVLGSLPSGRKVNCYTFGDPSNYETKIAKKLSKLKGANHQTFAQTDRFFPNVNLLKKYTLDTESVKICSWLEILENVEKDVKEPLLVGELCEALPGRNLKKFNSKEYRKANFFQSYIRKEPFDFEKSSPEKFELWKKAITAEYVRWHDENWFNKLHLTEKKEEIIKDLHHDLNEIFDRIEAHRLPYVEFYDELFSWYTYTRTRLADQVTICNEKFYAYSPAMSLQMLKRTSNIHPNLRLNYRFATKMFKQNKDLKHLTSVPTSQVPIIPQYFPDLLKMPWWGLRSKIDQILINRAMKSKDPNRRYRLFKSVDWLKIYQSASMEKNMLDYYKDNRLTQEYFKTFHKLALKRKKLTSWPFANIDIISGAALNMELNLIKKFNKN